MSTSDNGDRRGKKPGARLFSALASVERTDRAATERRERSRQRSFRRSRAAAGQAKLGGTLLELRILAQRCLTEEEEGGRDASTDAIDCAAGVDGNRVVEELDALLVNLLAARRELVGHQLGHPMDGGDKSDGNHEDIDYARSILLLNNGKPEEDEPYGADKDGEPSGSSSSNPRNDQKGSNISLSKIVQSEYESLRSHWKSTLDKHHSNVALQSGMSAVSSKFQTKAVDVSFWEQVRAGVEHQLFKEQIAVSSEGKNGRGVGTNQKLDFDDSRLYQQMLKDFISSSQLGSTARSTSMDPAQLAAARLKQAVQKRSGGEGDVELMTMLTEADGTGSLGGALSLKAGIKKKPTDIDRRASKGRKIRYNVLPKLVNFTFPVARPEPAINEDVWFSSLFGGVGNL